MKSPRLFLSALVLALLSEACIDTSPMYPDSMPSAQAGIALRTQKVAVEIAGAGCTVGQVQADGGVRVLALSRAELPFELPELETIESFRSKLAFAITKFDPVGALGNILVACIVPREGSYSMQVGQAIRSVSAAKWLGVLNKVRQQGKLVQEPLFAAVGTVLRETTFPKARKVDPRRINPGAGRGPAASSLSLVGTTSVAPTRELELPPSNIRELPGMTITAGYNYSVISYQSLMAFFQQLDRMSVEYFYDEQWARDCATYNSEYWKWDATKGQVDQATQNLIDALTGISEEFDKAEATLNAMGSCRPKSGKEWCIDFWIAKCWVGTIMGDCRDLDPNADYARSRMQIYLNPNSRQLEFHVSGTTIILPCVKPAISSGCPNILPAVYTRNDSAGMDPRVRIIDVQENGNFTLQVDVANNLCFHWSVPGCPFINTNIDFIRDSNVAGGWRFNMIGNKSPSIAIFEQTEGGFVLRDRHNEPKTQLGFLLGLIDAFRWAQLNKPNTPPQRPDGCYLE